MSNLTQAMEQSARLVGMFQSVIDLHSAIADVAGIEQVKRELAASVIELRTEKEAAQAAVDEAHVAYAKAQDDAAKLITDAQIAAAQIVADAKSKVDHDHASELAQHKATVVRFNDEIEALRHARDELTVSVALKGDEAAQAEDRVAKAEAKLAAIRASIGA